MHNITFDRNIVLGLIFNQFNYEFQQKNTFVLLIINFFLLNLIKLCSCFVITHKKLGILSTLSLHQFVLVFSTCHRKKFLLILLV